MNRLGLYRLAQRLLPQGLRHSLGRSALTRAVRDRLFRPGGSPLLVEGDVEWLDLRFSYVAPIQVLERAQRCGVENRICRLAKSLLKPGDLAVDVGSNYGFITTVMAHSVAPAGKVVAFEIEPPIQAAVRRTVTANALGGIVNLVPHGAAARTEDGFMAVDDALTDEPRPLRLLKIDVDGGDFDALRGARRSLEKHHPVVIVEMTEHQEDIYRFLLDVGYTDFIDQSNLRIVPGKWPENLIASVGPVKVPLRT